MTRRTLFLLLSLGACIACGLLAWLGFSGLAFGNRSGAKILVASMGLSGMGGVYCAFKAFDKRNPYTPKSYGLFNNSRCPLCNVELNFSLLPAFREEVACPGCGKLLNVAGLAIRPRDGVHCGKRP